MSLRSAFHRVVRKREVGRHSPATQFVSIAVLVLLCFQLSRVYLVIPAGAFVCNIPDHSHGAQHHDHTGDQEAEEALEIASVANQDAGHTYIQHCKDTLDGLGLTPAQPFGLPLATSAYTPETAVIALRTAVPAALDNFVPPPFQPPRNLS